MSVAVINSKLQFILPHINGSYCLVEEKGNEVRDIVVGQEGKYCHASDPTF
jgi:hypothetical protein